MRIKPKILASNPPAIAISATELHQTGKTNFDFENKANLSIFLDRQSFTPSKFGLPFMTILAPNGLTESIRRNHKTSSWVPPCDKTYSSFTTLATSVTLSSLSRFIRRTPAVLRPITWISFTVWRLAIPFLVIRISSSSSSTSLIATTSPLRSEVLTLITPLPPRLVTR